MAKINTDRLVKLCNNHIAFSEAGPHILRVMAPFFHEDGDMYDIFLNTADGILQICDFGTTLMRLSYKTDLDTDNKVNIFSKIVSNNGVSCEDGNLVLNTTYETFFEDLMQYQVAVSKVSNLDILKRENIATLFTEQLSQFIQGTLAQTYRKIKTAYHPTNESGFEVDYAILDNMEKPVYIMGVRDSLTASRATALCLRVLALGKKHTSIAVHEGTSTVANRDRDALTNAVDKQYTSLEDFKSQGANFIARQIA